VSTSTPDAAVIRTAAYLLAWCLPGRHSRGQARRALIMALAGLARTLAELRELQAHRLQRDAAARAAAALATVAALPDAPVTADAAFPGRPRPVRPKTDHPRSALGARPRPRQPRLYAGRGRAARPGRRTAPRTAPRLPPDLGTRPPPHPHRTRSPRLLAEQGGGRRRLTLWRGVRSSPTGETH
jgi:hypothetical protein